MRAEFVLLPVIVLGELEAGFQLGRRTADYLRVLAEFLGEPFLQVVNGTAEVAREYGRLFAALRRSGTPIPVNDIWIAAAKVATASHLVTLDVDFRRVPGLAVPVVS